VIVGQVFFGNKDWKLHYTYDRNIERVEVDLNSAFKELVFRFGTQHNHIT
jgi:hypothetical protein